MPYRDFLILMGMGGLFIVLGLATIFGVRSREKKYYDSLATNTDVREFLERPPRSTFGGLKIGGWTAVAVGLVMIVVGGVFWLWR